MIDEKKLIEELEDMIGMLPTHYIGKKDEENAYLDAINRTLSAVKRQSKIREWIPVEERLPKEHEIVLVAYLEYISNTKQLFNIAYISECGTWLWYFDGTNVRNEIIAWMPLPEPYKGSDEDVD